jgi:hypothetical protein
MICPTITSHKRFDESRATTSSLREQKDLGQNDARFIDTLAKVAQKVADSISHKLDPLVEQNAQMFAHGDRTPCPEASQRHRVGV